MLKYLVLLSLLPLNGTLDRVEQARIQGRYSEAAALVRQVAQESPVLFRANNLRYLQAVLEQQAGLKDGARQGFETLLDTDFPLPDSVLLHLIEVTDGTTPLNERRDYFETFLARFPEHPRWPTAVLQYADLLAEDNQGDEAKNWYERLISRGSVQARTARLKLADWLLKPRPEGDSTSRSEALTILERLLLENDGDSIAFEAVRRLRELESLNSLTESQLRSRALACLNNRAPDAARPYLNRLLTAFQNSSRRAEYEYLMARVPHLEGRRKDAIVAYDRVYRRFPASEWGLYSRYLSANLSLALQAYQQAAAGFREIVENHSQSEYFERAVVGLSDALVWLGDRTGAEEVLVKASSGTPDRGLGLNYHLARLRIDDGRYEEAARNLDRIAHLTSAELPSGVTREEVLFLKGLCEQQIGLLELSRSTYQDAARGRANYFGYLARERSEAASGREIRPAPITWSQRLFQARGELSSETQNPVSAPGTEFVTERRRLQELLFLRLFDEAYFELKRQGPCVVPERDGDYLFHLATWAQRAGLYKHSLDAAEQLRDSKFSRIQPEQYPPELQRLLFPLPYWDLVSRFGKQNGIDPYLLLALMRQESGFQPDAISAASARGLMQLMMPTARELARRMKMDSPDSAALFKPDISIRLGSFYLRQMLNNFGGVLEKGLAAYNGGPGNVRRWEKKVKTSEDPVMFVANIGFRETKLYVLRVLGYYRTYRNLYGQSG
ncbi:MAG TPA: transglycosylase SLT domain-containing protein [Acidobacteriota bacterium]|nr:transglycosylase SLT domain-containing protein [Acidobacteriota bacterium]